MLGDSAAATVMPQFEDSPENGVAVDAGVFVESNVFRGYQRIDDIGGNILEVYVTAVALILIIFAHKGTIFGKDLRGKGYGRVFQFLEGGQGAKDPQVDKDQEENKGAQPVKEDFPENANQFRRHGI